jgi:hypothetical protein
LVELGHSLEAALEQLDLRRRGSLLRGENGGRVEELRFYITSHEEFGGWTPPIGRQDVDGPQSSVRRSRASHSYEHLLRPGAGRRRYHFAQSGAAGPYRVVLRGPTNGCQPYGQRRFDDRYGANGVVGVVPQDPRHLQLLAEGPHRPRRLRPAKIGENLEETLTAVRNWRNIAVPSGLSCGPANGGGRVPGRQGATELVWCGNHTRHGLVTS